jgi:hypothetical protein
VWTFVVELLDEDIELSLLFEADWRRLAVWLLS